MIPKCDGRVCARLWRVTLLGHHKFGLSGNGSPVIFQFIKRQNKLLAEYTKRCDLQNARNSTRDMMKARQVRGQVQDQGKVGFLVDYGNGNLHHFLTTCEGEGSVLGSDTGRTLYYCKVL